VSLKSLTEGG